MGAMKRKLFVSLAAIALGAAFGWVTPAMAFHGGGFGGGMHAGGFGGVRAGGMGFGGGGFGGGMHAGGFGGVRAGGMGFGGGGFHGGVAAATGVGRGAIAAPSFHRFGGAPVGFQHNLAFRHDFIVRHRRNVAVFGAPFFYGDFYGDGCWRRVWTSAGWQWANICGDFGY
jgi:hypothetical protein